jgi:hypothetical protein
MEFTTTTTSITPVTTNNTATTEGITMNVNYQTDLRLLSNRKAIELNSISTTNEYEKRSAVININKKYAVIIEALEGLYAIGVEHSCSLASIVATFDTI